MQISISGPRGRGVNINSGGHEVKGQGHKRPKIDLKVSFSTLGSISFLVGFYSYRYIRAYMSSSSSLLSLMDSALVDFDCVFLPLTSDTFLLRLRPPSFYAYNL